MVTTSPVRSTMQVVRDRSPMGDSSSLHRDLQMQEVLKANNGSQASWRWQSRSVPTCTDTKVHVVQDVVPSEQVLRMTSQKLHADAEGQNPDAHENPELTLGSRLPEWEAPPIVFEQQRVASLRPGLLDKAGLGPLLVPSTKGIVDFSALGSAGVMQPLGRRRGPMTAEDFKEAMRHMNESFGKAINEIVTETVACRG